MAKPWRIIPKSSRNFNSNRSLDEISKHLEGLEVQAFGKSVKLIVTETENNSIQFEPAGKSVFQPICLIHKLEDNSYLYQVGIAKGILHACIITSLFPIFPLFLPEAAIVFSPETYFIYIPLIWILLTGIIWITSNRARKQIEQFVQELG